MSLSVHGLFTATSPVPGRHPALAAITLIRPEKLPRKAHEYLLQDVFCLSTSKY